MECLDFGVRKTMTGHQLMKIVQTLRGDWMSEKRFKIKYGTISTNYPNGCTKLIVEVVGSDNHTNIDFLGDQPFGNIRIDNWGGSINVNSSFDSASYEISGTTVIITYPTVTSVTKISTNGNGSYVYKAIT